MENNLSFSHYVCHGGTNFGFTAGANGKEPRDKDHYLPDITSYDYGAPCGEQGNTMPEIHVYRDIIHKYRPDLVIPDLPKSIPSMNTKPFPLQYVAPVKALSHKPLADTFVTPPYFESFDQNQGMAVYRTSIPAGKQAILTYEFFHDYGHIFLDGKRIHTVDRRTDYQDAKNASPSQPVTRKASWRSGTLLEHRPPASPLLPGFISKQRQEYHHRGLTR